jgi:protein-histidine pros-kinase
VQTQFPDYSYKEAALNPTNPADRATGWEADIIASFRQDPARKELITTRQTNSGPIISVARPVRITDRDCLTCHSVWSAAPPSMVQRYGSTNGFGWKLNEVIGAQIVSVPMKVALRRADASLGGFMVALAAVFAITLLLLNVLLTTLVVGPLTRIAAVANRVSLGEADVPELAPRGRDEVAQLIESFNRMRRSLANAMRMLAD